MERDADAEAAAELVGFWLDAGPSRWFAKEPGFDALFRSRFQDRHHAVARREHDGWARTALGALALVLLLDQFPRHAFRGTAHMYATDPLARRIAERALALGHDRLVDSVLRLFFYLPFAHSEDLADQERSVALNRQLGRVWEEHAIGHRDIIRRFGRFPHRNPMFGRDTTPEEAAFLAQGGFAG